jgi:5-formyltetrahydrofolate cyclo-ligase
MPALLEAKANLRRVMRATRDALGPAARRAATAQACQRLLALPEVQAARSLAVFSAIRGELDLAPLISDRRAAGAQILYPRVVAGLSPRLRFHVVLQPGQLVPGAYGIPEPPAEAPEVPAEAIEVVLVPGLAFDGAGRRLGYGGGYYDEVAGQGGGSGWGSGSISSSSIHVPPTTGTSPSTAW